MSECSINASCPKCGRNNPAAAKFCGGCGTPAAVQTFAENSIKSLRTEIISKRNSKNTPDETASVISHENAETCASEISTAQATRGTSNRLCKLLRKLPIYWRKKLAIGLFTSLSVLIVIFLSGLMPDNRLADARWLDFRAFLARSFELSHSELDQIFRETFGQLPDPAQMIKQQQAVQLEQTLKTLFQQPHLSIFPNPFFETGSVPLPVLPSSNNGYSDIPSSHPVYTALQPLLELGIVLADKQNRFRPYEPMSWNDWQNTVEQLFKLLAIEPDLSQSVASQRHGYMSNIDLRNYIEHLREKLFIKSRKPLLWIQETSYPGRLESFAALSAVIRELNK